MLRRNTEPRLLNIMDELSAIIPEQHRGTVSLIIVTIAIAGRAFHAIKNGGGLVGLWKALLYGTNAPKN